MRLIDELNELHDRYLREIDIAVGGNGFARAQRMSEAYENDAIQLMAVRENLTHLLPIRRGTPAPSELAALDLADITVDQNGLLIAIRRSRPTRRAWPSRRRCRRTALRDRSDPRP